MLSPEARAPLHRFVDGAADDAERLEIVTQMGTAVELQCLVHDYNWDDGFAIPTALADHPACDLGLALQFFWLADGIEWTKTAATRNQSGGGWNTIWEKLSRRLLSRHYSAGENSFDPVLGRAALYQLRKHGVPELFYSPL